MNNVLERLNKDEPVSREEKLELLRLAAQKEILINDSLFDRIFGGIINDSEKPYSGWEKAILGSQAGKYILKRLENADISNSELERICDYIFWASRANLPPRALGLLLPRLSIAVQNASNNPGSNKESRDWGWYEFSQLEDLADALSRAILVLADARYSKSQWKTLIRGIRPLKHLDLRQIVIADAASSGVTYRKINLYDRLLVNCRKLNKPEILQFMDSVFPKK